MTDKSPTTEHKKQQQDQLASLETQARIDGGFDAVEKSLQEGWARSGLGILDSATSLLGHYNLFAKKADPRDNYVWLLDNTAYRPIHPYAHAPQPWQAVFVACYFNRGRRDISKIISSIADQIGLDGKAGADEEVRERVSRRLQPFVSAVAAARTVKVKIPRQSDDSHSHTLGPSNSNGISSQIVLTGGADKAGATTIETSTLEEFTPPAAGVTYFADPEGWAVISDIDDTIKITQTTSPIGILQTTFADVPQTTEGMPEFYKTLDETFLKPTWFYLSASPYNLYPFLRKFLHAHYIPGTLILRDKSWMFIGGLLQSLTLGVQAYKVDRMHHIHDWLPKRKFICIGDSTQSDPEAYSQVYKQYKGWIHAIFIRKVVNLPNMEKKNEDERFEKAFEGVPKDVWHVFVSPNELADHIKRLVQ